MQRNWPFLIVFSLVGLIFARASLAAGFDEGIRQYDRGEYQQASASLSRAITADPSQPKLHYYLANCLVHMQEHERAIEQYRRCFALDPTGPYSQYCKRAIAAYHAKLPNEAEIKKISDTANGAALSRRAMSVAVRPDASNSSSAQVDYGRQSRTLSIIRKQVDGEKNTHDNTAEATATDAMELARRTVRSINEAAELQIQRLYSAPTRRMTYASTMDLATREQQIRDGAKAESEHVMRQAAQKADRYRQLAEGKKNAFDEVADNLEHQFADDGKNSGIRLVPQGTNLYVRSYASAPTIHALPDAHAAVARIYAQGSGDTSTSPANVRADKLPGSERPPERSVQAKILD